MECETPDDLIRYIKKERLGFWDVWSMVSVGYLPNGDVKVAFDTSDNLTKHISLDPDIFVKKVKDKTLLKSILSVALNSGPVYDNPLYKDEDVDDYDLNLTMCGAMDNVWPDLIFIKPGNRKFIDGYKKHEYGYKRLFYNRDG